MWVHGSKSQAHLSINNALSESIMFLLLYANAGKLCVVCETGRWYSSSLWPCHAVTVSGVESPSILLPWACLWVEAVPARHQIKPPPHLLYFTVFFLSCIYFPFVSPFPSPLSLPLPACVPFSLSSSDCCRGPDACICGGVSVCLQRWVPTWCRLICTIIILFDPYLIACSMPAMKPSCQIRCYQRWFTKLKGTWDHILWFFFSWR